MLFPKKYNKKKTHLLNIVADNGWNLLLPTHSIYKQRNKAINMRKLSQAPNAIHCPLCNGKYFKQSFPIHHAQCKKLFEKTHEECPCCKRSVHIDEMVQHTERCFDERAKKRAMKKKVQSLNLSSAEISGASSATTELKINKLNESGFPDQNQDYRIECTYCHRKFNPDRIEKHESICSAIKPEVRSAVDRNVKKKKFTPHRKLKIKSKKNAKFIKPRPIIPSSTPSILLLDDESGQNNDDLESESKTNARTKQLVEYYERLPDKIQLQILEITKSFHEMMQK